MRVLFNATPLIKGGAIQVAVSAIREALNDPAAVDWHFAISRPIATNLEQWTTLSPDRFSIVEKTPARSLTSRWQLANIERRIQPDAVFSVCGSGYVRFQAPHLLGFVNPWISHATDYPWQTLPWIPRQLQRLQVIYQAQWYCRADRWVTESEASRQGIAARMGIPLKHIAVVPNSCGQLYLDEQRETPFPDRSRPVRLLCFSAAYPHKCIDLIPSVAAALRKNWPELPFEFVVTLPETNATWQRIRQQAAQLQVLDRIQNVGVVPISGGPELYKSCDVCFLPTVLETFTATYPEAMAMGTPIVTSDLDFAQAICGESAHYFQPRNAEDAARAIHELLSNREQWKRQIQQGKQILATLPTPRWKYEGYRSLLELLVAGRDFSEWRMPTAETSPAYRRAG